MHPTNHWKLGLFVVLGFVLALCTVVFLGARSLHKDSVKYKTYFDESVQGLEVGSPIKFRGVTIGNVSAIDIAPDGRHVGVTSELTLTDLAELGIAEGKGANARIRVPPELRVQLASQGITGVKFLQIDFFVIADNPPPVLPFPVPENYIPAAVSTMKNLEDAVVKAVDRVPEITDNLVTISKQVSTLLASVEDKKLPDKAEKTLMHFDSVLTSLQATIKALDAGKLSKDAQGAIANANVMIKHADGLLARIDGDKGLVASAQRTSDAFGDMATAVNASGLSQTFEETLRDIQEFTAAFQRVADAIERDPDMLVKGVGKPK
jgi:phospholipid/cholesterol/gamma-HCH transport system substrate-binding protein